jgi:hypothetical protein
MLENDLGITFSRKVAIQRRKRANLPKESPDAINVDSLGFLEDVFLDRSGSESTSLPKHNFVSFKLV